MNSTFERLKERKLVQWAVAYLAGAWALLQVVDLVGNQFSWQARIAAVLGERERAVTLLTNAYTKGRSNDASVHAEMDFESLRGYPPFRELLRPKG
jgi:hypothetical protein